MKGYQQTLLNYDFHFWIMAGVLTTLSSQKRRAVPQQTACTVSPAGSQNCNWTTLVLYWCLSCLSTDTKVPTSSQTVKQFFTFG